MNNIIIHHQDERASEFRDGNKFILRPRQRRRCNIGPYGATAAINKSLHSPYIYISLVGH
jgi:hypothetical protein